MSKDLMLKAGKAAAWVGAAKWFDVIGVTLTLLVTARLLPPEAFGIFGMALLAILIPETFLGGALSESLIQRKDLRPGHLSAAFLLHIALYGIFMLGLIAATPIVVAHFEEPVLAQLVPAIAAVLIFNTVGSVPGAILQRELRFGTIALADAAGTMSAAAFGIGLSLAGFGVWALFGMEAARRVAKAVVFVGGARWLPSLSIRWADFADLMRFNTLTLTTRLLGQLDAAIPRFFVGSILGAQALGYFHMAMRLYQQLSAVMLAPFTAVALPVAAAVQNDRDRLHEVFAGGTRAAAMIAYPVFIGAASVLPLAIPIVLGEKWIPIVVAAQILLLTTIRSPINTFNGEILRGTGKPGLQLAVNLFGAVIALVLVPLATPHGIAWTSAAVFTRGMLQWVLAAIIVERALGYPAVRQFVIGWESLTAGAVMGLTVLSLSSVLGAYMPLVAEFAVLIAVGVVVHVVVLSLLAPSLARRLFNLAAAIVRRDRKAVSRELGLS